MGRKLSKKEFLSISLMLFAMLFGAGNLIFPPILGNQAANATLTSLTGFALTAVIFPVLGILAIAKTKGIKNLGKRVGSRFAILYPAILFLAIGPGIAIPRNASLAFEMSVLPYLTEGSSIVLSRIFYTVIFFLVAYYLSIQPGKLVDRIGKIVTPVLFSLIIIFFIGGIINLPVNIGDATGLYEAPFTTGILEGYHTMDILASLNFGLLVATTIKSYKIKDEKRVIKYASQIGLLAGSLLFIVYSMLAYIGMISSGKSQAFENGGQILFEITNNVFGSFGSIILVTIFTLACLTTVVGLVTSVSQYFSELTNDKITYHQWLVIYSFISFVLANFGLNTILKFSLPILASIYPTAIVLIV
ncbi:MAG: branched-chain amino acid transport system II carrier protein, partial [Atopostipes sp.]|nr:branched-chain amino acid transport system II carrier protein [Atopostipes sp.]